jgi:hypothetical protein
MREQIELQRGLCERLEALATHFLAAEEVSADEFIRTIERITMIDKYYTAEQLEYLKKRAEEVGEERMQQAPGEWAELIALVKAEMQKGTDPSDPAVQALAKRWRGLVNEFTGGDPGIEQSLRRLWTEQANNIAAQHGTHYYDPQVSEYIGKATSTGRGSS